MAKVWKNFAENNGEEHGRQRWNGEISLTIRQELIVSFYQNLEEHFFLFLCAKLFCRLFWNLKKDFIKVFFGIRYIFSVEIPDMCSPKIYSSSLLGN